MKKLLSILAISTIITTSTTNVVSCGHRKPKEVNLTEVKKKLNEAPPLKIGDDRITSDLEDENNKEAILNDYGLNEKEQAYVMAITSDNSDTNKIAEDKDNTLTFTLKNHPKANELAPDKTATNTIYFEKTNKHGASDAYWTSVSQIGFYNSPGNGEWPKQIVDSGTGTQVRYPDMSNDNLNNIDGNGLSHDDSVYKGEGDKSVAFFNNMGVFVTVKSGSVEFNKPLETKYKGEPGNKWATEFNSSGVNNSPVNIPDDRADKLFTTNDKLFVSSLSTGDDHLNQIVKKETGDDYEKIHVKVDSNNLPLEINGVLNYEEGLYVATEKGLFYSSNYEASSPKFESISNIDDAKVNNIMPTSNNKIFLASTDKGLYSINTKDNTSKLFEATEGKNITTLFESSNNNIFYSIDNKGMYEIMGDNNLKAETTPIETTNITPETGMKQITEYHYDLNGEPATINTLLVLTNDKLIYISDPKNE